MARRGYSGVAPTSTLMAGFSAAATAMLVNDGAGYPQGAPFAITIDRGKTTEERILVGERTGANFTSLTRGWDGTPAAAHDPGAKVEHTLAALDLDEPNAHINGTGFDHTAASVTVTPAGNVQSANVQAAIQELDAEKAPLTHSHAHGHTANARIAQGTYTGDSAVNRTIDLGWGSTVPAFVVVQRLGAAHKIFLSPISTFGGTGYRLDHDMNDIVASEGYPQLVAGGFVVTNGVGASIGLNVTGDVYSYVAFGAA